MSFVVRLSGASSFGNRPSMRRAPPQGGFPPLALPFLVLAAAAPVYGYTKCQQEIAVARKKYEEDIKAGRVAPPKPKAPKA